MGAAPSWGYYIIGGDGGKREAENVRRNEYGVMSESGLDKIAEPVYHLALRFGGIRDLEL
jgi:hypothetical protein